MSLGLLVAIITLYSVVQSIFGVGVLVFGTPTLLLLGVPFQEALGWLLPCSITINALQLMTDWREVSLKRRFLLSLAPAVGMGLTVLLLTERHFDVKFAVGILLLFIAVSRLSDRLYRGLQHLCSRSLWVAVPFVGFVHGLTNMGGGLLTILVSALHREKTTIRANVAFGYLIMALSQCGVLACLHANVFRVDYVIPAAVAGLTYLTVGRRAFEVTSNRAYQAALTTLIVLFGIILIH